MRQSIKVVLVGAALLAVYVGYDVIVSSVSNTSARIAPAQADNGELGTFWLSAGEHEVTDLEYAGICFQFRNTTPPQVLAKRLRSTATWVSWEQWQLQNIPDNDADMIRYQIFQSTEVLRYACQS